MTQDPVGQKTQGTGTPAFHKDGAIGSMFKADGAIGGTADKVGGPFAKDGFVGLVFPSHFLPSLFLSVSKLKLWGELGDHAKWLTRVVIGRKLQRFGSRDFWRNFLMLCDV
jgi:hypothetical protein